MLTRRCNYSDPSHYLLLPGYITWHSKTTQTSAGKCLLECMAAESYLNAMQANAGKSFLKPRQTNIPTTSNPLIYPLPSLSHVPHTCCMRNATMAALPAAAAHMRGVSPSLLTSPSARCLSCLLSPVLAWRLCLSMCLLMRLHTLRRDASGGEGPSGWGRSRRSRHSNRHVRAVGVCCRADSCQT